MANVASGGHVGGLVAHHHLGAALLEPAEDVRVHEHPHRRARARASRRRVVVTAAMLSYSPGSASQRPRPARRSSAGTSTSRRPVPVRQHAAHLAHGPRRPARVAPGASRRPPPAASAACVRRSAGRPATAACARPAPPKEAIRTLVVGRHEHGAGLHPGRRLVEPVVAVGRAATVPRQASGPSSTCSRCVERRPLVDVAQREVADAQGLGVVVAPSPAGRSASRARPGRRRRRASRCSSALDQLVERLPAPPRRAGRLLSVAGLRRRDVDVVGRTP